MQSKHKICQIRILFYRLTLNFIFEFRPYFFSVCLSSITHDIMAMILRLIYGGAVAVPACDMRAFMKAAKYLKLPGFEQIPSSVSAKDIQIPRRRNYSIVLKRIDEDGNFAIGSSSAENNEQQHGDTQSNEQPTMTNGDDPNGGDNSSDSSEFGNGDDDNGDGGDHDDHADDGNAGCVKYNTSSNNIVCQTNGYPLSSSSSSESAMSTSDDEHTGKTFTSISSYLMYSKQITNYCLKILFHSY